MAKLVLTIALVLNLLVPGINAQSCEITEVNAVALPCTGNLFSVSIDLEVTNPSSPGFTLAGNGVIYGTYLYADLPVTIGPFLGDDESVYDFIAWDVENAACQNYVWLPASNCGPICSISNFELEFVSCVSNQSAIVVFDFDVQNPTGITFDLYDWEGDELGTWLYESLPVTLPFFQTNGAAPIILTVCDHNNPDCCETFELDAIDCNPNNCEIFNITVDPQCTGSNFLAHLNFGFDNPPSDSFTVMGNTLNYGTFGYNELPVTLGPLNGGSNINWEFLVADSENPSCTDTFLLGMYQCPPPCNILAMEAMALECNGNEAFALEIGMDIEGEGDLGFAVFSDTYYYGTYEYENLPVVIPAFEVSGELIDYVSVCDNDNMGCCTTTPFEALLCNGCLIYNLTATALPCDEEGMIMVEIDFDHQNVSPEGFEVTGNGNNYGEFAYEDLPILVGPFLGDGSQYFEFVVTDLGDEFCFEAVELGFIDCEDICELSNLVVETGACTGNNQYVMTLDFDHQGPIGDNFDLFLNGDLYGSYSYTSLPLTIEEFPGSGLDTLQVCDHAHPDCCTSEIVEAPNCACHIFDLTAENIGCTSDSTFGVSLEFFYENLPGDFVDVFLDGELIGFYNVADIPILVHIPEGDGTAVISVCANDLNTCCDEVLIELINCETPECHIFELFAETGDCNSDSTFLLDIVFEYSNLPTDSVLVYANGDLIGQYQVNPDFIRIEQFPVVGTDTTTLTVCAVGEPDCCATYDFATPDCSLFGQCHIWDLVAETGDCTSDSTYILHLNFEFQNLPTDSVDITGNGNFIARRHVHEGAINFEHFPVLDSTLTVITVCAAGDPTCCDTVVIETPDCSQFSQCHIWDLVIDVLGCTSDSTFFAFINYNYNNLPGDSITVTGNGNDLGTYAVHPNGFIIEDFPEYSTNHTVLTVCALGDPACCDTIEFETPNCEGPGDCHIVDLVADAGECTSDSTYNLFIHYFGINLPSDSVTVEAQGMYIGTFPHNPNGFTIQNFPAFVSNHTNITVCALNAPDCCDSFEFETPNCGQNEGCHIFDLFAETGDCTSDSTYVLDVVFESLNLPTDSVVIYANDVYVGQYFNSPTFIHIENFPVLEPDETTVTVCALGDPECCDHYTFPTPFCTDTCVIYDIHVNVFDCNSDSTFTVVVNFEYQNITAGGFDIYAGSEYLGFFNFDQIPAEIHHFPSNETGNYIITICESDSTECCASYEFEGPACGSGNCDIFNLEYALTPCDSAGNFYFILDFDVLHPGNGGYNVVGNGNNYGNFSYDSIPVYIGPFPTDDTVYEFGVFDAEHPDCGEDIAPGIVECLPVSTIPVNAEIYFQVLNNGSVPVIFAKKDISLTLFFANGQQAIDHRLIQAGSTYELASLPPGLFFAFVRSGPHTWPVKLVKGGL